MNSIKFPEEQTQNLEFLTLDGYPYHPDSFFHSDDDDGIFVVTSDDRQATIVSVCRMRTGCAASNNSTSVRYTTSIIPESGVLPELFSNVKLARSIVDSWLASYTAKAAPKAKRDLAERMINSMASVESEYFEMLEDGIEQYIHQNLGI